MTAELLRILIELNIILSAAIAVVIVVRPVYRRQFGSKATAMLWVLIPVAFLALLIPSRHEIVSVPLAINANGAIKQELPLGSEWNDSPGASSSRLMPFNVARAPEERSVLANASTWVSLWILGVILSAGHFTGQQRRYVAGLGQLTLDSGETSATVFRTKASGTSPAVLGLFRPKIILPHDLEKEFSAAQRKLILAHEQAHISAYDVPINFSVITICCLAWFNPLVHWAARLIREDQELACDEIVTSRHPQLRRLYAETLLQSRLGMVLSPIGCAWPASTKSQLAKRLTTIAALRHNTHRQFGHVGALAALAMTVGCASWGQKPPRIVLDPHQPVSEHMQEEGIATADLTASIKRTIAARAISIRDLAAKVIFLPENRDDIEIQISQLSNLPRPTFELENGRLVVDGGLRLESNYCRGRDLRNDYNDYIEIARHGRIHRSQVPILTIKVPETLDIELEGYVDADIGPSKGGSVINDGCGRVHIGAASGPLHVMLSNYGDVNVDKATDHLDATLYGFGDMTMGGAKSANLFLTGIGNMKSGSISRRVTARLIGEGNIQIAEVKNGAEIDLPGEGNIVIANLVGDFSADLSGAGDVTVGRISSSRAEVDLTGSGSVEVLEGSIGRISHNVSGSGVFRMGDEILGKPMRK